MRTKKIVVISSGWVVIGMVETKPDMIIIHDASVIRKWGTTAGLGEIATRGPTKETTLDYTGKVEVFNQAVIMQIVCEV